MPTDIHMQHSGFDVDISGNNKHAKLLQKAFHDKSNVKDKNKRLGISMLTRNSKDALNLKAPFIAKAKEMLCQIEDSGVLNYQSVDSKVATVIFMVGRMLH